MPDDALDPNRSQVRIIAEQMLEVWDTRQESKRSRFTASVPAWIACALSLSTLIYVAGGMGATVNSNTNRIDKLEAVQVQQTRDDIDRSDRLARIEAKVDLLVEGTKR